jgi:hypothetical protein
MESPRFLENITIRNKPYEDMGNSPKEDFINNRDLDTFNEIRLFSCLDMKCLELSLPKTDKIYVKTMTGRTIDFDMNILDTVDSLHRFISEKEGVPIDQQRLIFASKQLERGRFLSDYNIKNGAYVHLVLRLRGGMHHDSSNGGVAVVQQEESVDTLLNSIEKKNVKTERDLMIELLMKSWTTDEEFDLIDMADTFRVEDD